MEPSKERYNELCRLCASYDAVKMDIFGNEGKNRQLVDKIQTCLPFKIDEDDRLPKCLCYRCMYNLENFYDFRTACVNAVALLERCLPQVNNTLAGKRVEDRIENNSELRTELLKEKEKMPILIPEAPIVNPNAALGTPPRLNSDGEAYHEVQEIRNVNEDGRHFAGALKESEDTEDRKSDEYEMDMETNPSDFLEMTSMLTEESEENAKKSRSSEARSGETFQHSNEQHEVYVCSLCNKAFSSKGHLSLHARIHVGAGDVIGAKVVTDDHTSYKRPYQCDLCNKSYSTAKHRWGHVSTTHRGHPAVTCAYCSRIYSTRTNLEEHIKSRHTGLPPPPELPVPYVQQDNRYRCKTCPKMYTNVTDLNKHARVCAAHRSKDRPSKKIPGRSHVDTSDVSSSDTDDERKDYRTAEAKLSKNPQLTILKQALTKNESLKRDYDDGSLYSGKSVKVARIEKNDGELQKRWYCEMCPQNFTSVEKLKEHETIHDAERPYVCLLCEKDFVLKTSLSRHIVSAHGVDPTPILDSEKCLKKSAIAQSWRKKLTKSEGRKRAREPSDSSEDAESSHGNVIEIETVFVCEICTRDFNDRASLWLHIRATHKEFAAFACGVCLKICSDNAQLLNHVNMYHGGSKLLVSEQRRYSCTICGRQHDSRKKLMTHVSIHNVDPGYDPASFVQLNANYYNDTLNSNDGNDHSMDFDADDSDKVDCFICYKSFPNEDHLVRHQRNAHKFESAIPSNDVTIQSNGSGPNGTKAQYHLFFVCELCGSSHPSKWERWLHVSSNHSDDPSMRCEREDCGKIFATKTLRNEHAQHHLIQGPSPNTCEVCGKLWGSRVDYWKHVMGVHSDTVPLICGVCLKVFPDVGKLSAHVRANHWPLTNGDFSCDICGRPYSNKSKMSRHRKIHGLEASGEPASKTEPTRDHTPLFDKSPEQPEVEALACEMCSELSFDNWQSLCNHRRTIHGLFPCDLCNKCYGRTSHLWKHVNRVHKGHEDVTCRYCLKTSASKEHLMAHIAKIHRYEPEGKRLESLPRETASVDEDAAAGGGLHHCDKCQKSFHKRYLLRRHMKGCQNYRKDPGALLTRCRACERIFKDRASLQKHIENHHSEYTCHLCNETVTSKLGIMTHNRVNHLHHPDLTCEVSTCGKLFRTKEDLETHRKDHKYHGTPNVCDFCGDTVENKLKLKMHVLSLHRNEIGVSCGVCLIPMKDPKDLKKHVEDEHEGVLLKPNTCQVCGKRYASKWKAFDHTNKCHGKVFRTCKQCLAVFTSDADICYHYEHIHNVSKDQLAGYEKRPEDFETCDVHVKDEPEDYEYEESPLCDEDSYEPKRRRDDSHDTYDCAICPEIFLNRETLADHYRNVHNTDPDRMFKRMKLEPLGNSKKMMMRERQNFECKNCAKQFCTKTLFWNHINVCTRRPGASSREDSAGTLGNSTSIGKSSSGSILEARLKNNNKIKKEPVEPVLLENNLNIPDFNLFEDINMQLSEQKPIPNLMPLSELRLGGGKRAFSAKRDVRKEARKDSRKVYDESTNTACICEVCGKQWPAKKHLWQHLIRFHRTEAAVTCGVCLKLCTNYEQLTKHLETTHQSILSREGNNFTCKICGRYHNARSKLLLHMSIHINANGLVWCDKCDRSFENEEKLNEHAPVCHGRDSTFEEHATRVKIEEEEEEEDDKGSLIGDGASMTADGEVEDPDYSDHRELPHSENSEDSDSSGSSNGSDSEEHEGDDEDLESRTNSRATGEVTCHSDTEEESQEGRIVQRATKDTSNSKQKNLEEAQKNVKVDEKSFDSSAEKPVDINIVKQETCDDDEDEENEESDEEVDDDEGPPILSPIVPLSVENNVSEERDDAVTHKLSPVRSLTGEKKTREESVKVKRNTEEADAKSKARCESEEPTRPTSVAASNEEASGDEPEEREEETEEQTIEDMDEQLDDEDSRIHVVNPDDEYHSDDSQDPEEEAEEEEEEEEQEEEQEMELEPEEDEGDEDDEEAQVNAEDEEEEEGEGHLEEVQDEEEDEEHIEDNSLQIQHLDGTVLMVANDADGNQILIQRNVSDMENEDSMEGLAGYIYEDDEYGFTGFQVEHGEAGEARHQIDDEEEAQDEEGEEEEAEEAEEIEDEEENEEDETVGEEDDPREPQDENSHDSMEEKHENGSGENEDTRPSNGQTSTT